MRATRERKRTTLVAPPAELSSPRNATASEVLIDSIAHEAAQPMQALSSMLREINVVASQRPVDALERIQALSADGTKMLNEVRPLQDEMRAANNLARGERLRATYVRKEFAALAETLVSSAKAMHIALSFRSAEYWLRIDSTALRRIIKILVGNAIKHSGASSICVRAFSDGNGLLIAVRDDGDGISAETLGRLFVPPNELAVAEEWRARRGFGLYIVRLMLARMGGTLMVRSSPLGTTFFVHWLRPVIHNPEADHKASVSDGSMNGHLIVMLDDDERALGASSRLFEALGARVMGFTDELDLLAACQKLPRPPSLFILDYRLSDGTCKRVLDSLRRWRKDDFNCVVLTGDDAVSAALRDLQRDVFIATKPLNDWALAHIQRFLRGEIARIAQSSDATRA